MTLWDFLDTCQCNQELYIYLVNDYGEYLPVYHGTKQDIDFWEDNIFEVLQNKIEVFGVLPDGSMQVEVRDTYFDKPMREQFNKDRWDYWKEHPDKAPWGDWTDTEAYCQIVRRKSRWFHDIRDCGQLLQNRKEAHDVKEAAQDIMELIDSIRWNASHKGEAAE